MWRILNNFEGKKKQKKQKNPDSQKQPSNPPRKRLNHTFPTQKTHPKPAKTHLKFVEKFNFSWDFSSFSFQAF
jgi:hypothetical protein